LNKKKLLSVIIPCRNQEDKLPQTFKWIIDHSKKLPYDVEVIFVNDRSTDNSRKVAEKYQLKIKNMKILDTPKDFVGIGKGMAVKMGMIEAKGDFRLFMDADNSTAFSEVDKLLPYAKKYQAVIVSRYSCTVSEPETNWFKAVFWGVKDVLDVLIFGHAKRYTAQGKQGRLRQFISRGGNLAFTVLLGQSFADQRCGFKMFSKDATELIFPKIQLPGFGFDTEIFVITKKYKIKPIQVPVDWYDDAQESNVGVKDAINTFKEIFQIYGFRFRGKYGGSIIKNLLLAFGFLILSVGAIFSLVYFLGLSSCRFASEVNSYIGTRPNVYFYGEERCRSLKDVPSIDLANIENLPELTGTEVVTKKEHE